jgi:hypothetical protein
MFDATKGLGRVERGGNAGEPHEPQPYICNDPDLQVIHGTPFTQSLQHTWSITEQTRTTFGGSMSLGSTSYTQRAVAFKTPPAKQS